MNRIRAIAIHLPQFHPFSENDEWWGKGFTEWTNVTKAKPQFKEHYQPHLPADLGFYDLRLEESRTAQAKLAKEHGIYGFCFYHYWFNGKRLLNRPLDDMLASKKPDFPFMYCWANENWSRNWDGGFDKLLIEQKYSVEDDEEHMTYLCQHVFSDSRYIKVDGRPVFAVYKAELFPDARQTTAIWNKVAEQAGFPGIYLIRMESLHDRTDPGEIGFDAAAEFQPEWSNMPERLPAEKTMFERLTGKKDADHPYSIHRVFAYKSLVEKALQKKWPPYKLYPCVTPGWDNTARRQKNAVIFTGSTPELYGSWLHETIKKFKPYSNEENFVFINAWNEWAEGNHLEPCQKWGTAYLEQTKLAVQNTAGDAAPPVQMKSN